MTADAEWYFKLFIPGDNLSDPKFTEALFSGDDESALARSLVREAIQNSLDAKRPDAPIVTVRLTLRRGATAVLPGASNRFTGGIWPHLKASNSGLSSPPSRDATVPCLIVEDFGTHGLRGDPEHWQPTGVEKNGYFLFFRALGRSGKSDEDRGRWGVGKFVFPMCSRAHTIWGYTVPSTTNRALLMGRTVLDTHEVQGDSFHPDGHWGIKRDPSSNFVSPVTDLGLQQDFRRTFGLERSTEPGLSVVIPWVLPDVTGGNLVRATVTEYFLPIFKKQLRVIVSDDESETTIDDRSIADLASLVSKPISKARLELARRVTSGDMLPFKWPKMFSYEDTDWSRNGLPPDLLSDMREALEAEMAISVAFSLKVRRKDTGAIDTGKLFVHLQRVEGLGSAKPLIVREGISISAEKTKSVVDHVAIITADDGPVATLIGDAETPAHEELRPNLIKDKYTYHQKVTSFVREAPWSLLRTMREADQSDDPLLLSPYFPLQSADGRRGPKVDPQKRGGSPPIVPSIPRSPRRFRITRVEGGFKVRSNPEHAIRPAEVRVLVAYDVRRGNPLKRYRSFDFDLAAKPIAIELSGCELISARGNELGVSIVADTFSVEVTGFDSHRDLIVKALPSGGDA
jgi:hypothetical protein